MGNLRFKEGDIVYHKATQKRGVIVAKGTRREWIISWKDGSQTEHNEVELFSEGEWKNLGKREY